MPRAKPVNPARYTSRACLRCGNTFASEGAHNRLCNPCRYYATYQCAPVAVGAVTSDRFERGVVAREKNYSSGDATPAQELSY